MKLYLARFTLRKSFYMSETQDYPNQLRLVWAKSQTDAGNKIAAEYEFSSSGGDSISVWDLELEEALT